jgi:TPR repeat protein
VDDGLPAAEADAVQLLARGNRMLELGDLASARLFFRVVAERGDANAAMLMGLTFDPVYFRQQGIRGAPPEADEAMDWYRRAIASGSKEAEQRSRVLVSWLHWRAETGDGEAARVLQRLR